MRDPEKLREIDSLGLSPEDEWREEPEEEEASSGWGGVPLLQALLCAAALIALLFLKFTDPERYQEAAGWYQKEMAQEIELPQLRAGTPSPEPSPEPSADSTPPAQASSPPEIL